MLQLEDACQRALAALDNGDAEARGVCLGVEIGFHARGRDVYRLMGERMVLRRTAPARRGRQKAGKTKADPATVRASYQEKIEAGMAPKNAKADIKSEFEIKSSTTSANLSPPISRFLTSGIVCAGRSIR